MSISNEIRNKNIRRNEKYKDVVNLLVYGTLGESREGQYKIFNDIKDLIIFAAMVGKKYDRKEKVDPNSSIGIIMGTFSGSGSSKGSRVDQHNVIFMFGLLVFRDMNYLRDEKINEVIDIFEQYSNGGLQIIKNWLVESGWNPLCLLDHISDQLQSDVPSGIEIEQNPF
ncbi:MAG: hypothetical protein ACU88J_04225 [Gammaproteobacteria bacterium]